MMKSIPKGSILCAQAAPVGCRSEETRQHGEKAGLSASATNTKRRGRQGQYLCPTTTGNSGSFLLKGHKGPECQQAGEGCASSEQVFKASICFTITHKGDKLSSEPSALCQQLAPSLWLFYTVKLCKSIHPVIKMLTSVSCAFGF